MEGLGLLGGRLGFLRKTTNSLLKTKIIMAKYKLKTDINARGYANALTIPYTGPSLKKTFLNGSIVNGVEKTFTNPNGTYSQPVILVDEQVSGLAYKDDTNADQFYTGKVQWAIDPTSVEKVNGMIGSYGPSGTSSSLYLGTGTTQQDATMLSAKNILIGIVVIIAIWGILKFTKVV